jgi:AraC-like DNA-binding protein
MFYLAGVGLSFFLTLLLLSKRHKSIADKILAAWLIVITFHLLLFYFFKASLYPGLLGLGIPIPLMHGPFLYWYTRALTGRPVRHVLMLTHFVLPIAEYLYMLPFLMLTAEEKTLVFENNGIGYEAFNLFNSIAIIASGVLYIVLSSLALRKHRISIEQEFSSTDKVNLQWLQYMIYWLGTIWIFVIAGDDVLVFGAAVLFVAFIGFFGIRQAGIFHSLPASEYGNPTPAKIEVVEDLIERKKYQKSGLSSAESQNIHHQLMHVMASEKLFCESELSLADLAARLNTQPNYLSQVINEREGKNFYDYINTLRIEEFKRLAVSPDSRKFTLMALAEASGFNSKSSFNRYFKRISGQSPSEFMVSVSEPQN